MFPIVSILTISLLIAVLLVELLFILKLRKKYNLLLVERDLLLREQEQINDTFRDIRSQRHDSMIHVNALYFLMEQKQWQEAQNYIRQLVHTLDSTNFAIRGEAGHMAAQLLQCLNRAQQNNIAVKYDLEIPLSELPLNTLDQSKLIGNLLSNSLDAASEYSKEEEDASIMLSTIVRSGLYMIEISNSTLPLEKEMLDSLFRSYGRTTKQGEHQGLGTYIIHKIVTDHHGKLDFVYKKKTMTIKIKLPILT